MDYLLDLVEQPELTMEEIEHQFFDRFKVFNIECDVKVVRHQLIKKDPKKDSSEVKGILIDESIGGYLEEFLAPFPNVEYVVLRVHDGMSFTKNYPKMRKYLGSLYRRTQTVELSMELLLKGESSNHV